MTHPLQVELDRRPEAAPLYVQIRERLALLIRRGDLSAGTRLPPERDLAEMLRVNRTTVVRAYGDLAAAGLVHAHVGRGTIVQAASQPIRSVPPTSSLMGRSAANLPEAFPWASYLREATLSGTTEVALTGAPPTISLNNRSEASQGDMLLAEVVALAARDDVISLAAGTPDPAFYPVDEFCSLLTSQLRADGGHLLQHCPIEGLESLRSSLASWLNRRWQELSHASGLATGQAVPLELEHLMVLSGSQQGLWLVARGLLAPGDTVLVETPTYLGALRVFAAAGLRIVGVACDREGMEPEALRSALERYRPRLVYCLPTFQNPSGATMSLARRYALLELAQRYQTPILEDDPYGELFYAAEPPPPLAALDQSGLVLYLGTCSKILFPGIRLGWIAAPRPVIAQLGLWRQYIDLHANTPGQAGLDGFLREGLLDAHLARVRERYREKRDLLSDALETMGHGLLHWQRPDGGYYLWCALEGGLQARDAQEEAARLGVAFVPGDAFYPNAGGESHLRLNFTGPDAASLQEGARRIGQALERLSRRARRQERPPVLAARRPLV
ncbi:MAG TPA: PLP-dependent aminotransferase family protein [Ktedonobacterales bacterium]|nr:PLP-dependent aminotransferase family protein [Ktedonobacterales bacterium]